MAKSDEQTVLEMAQTMIQNQMGEEPLTLETIATIVDRVMMMDPRWQLDRDAVIAQLEIRFSVWIGRTRVLEDNKDHEAWLTADRRKGWRLWPRYRQYLEQTLPAASVDGVDDATDQILSRLEDPNRAAPWDRRGLVVGHVQSGKTSNYTGLLCKAADAGYKVIIVLAGIHKNLRSQTQMRLDEGFLGYETAPVPDAQGLRSIGVGLIDSDHGIRPDFVTNRADDGDFKLSVVRNLGISPGGRPLLFVVKKNGPVLRNIITWVTDLLNGREALSDSLLIVDDEADHASVDTREQARDENGVPDPDHDPATINGLIRALLMKFERSAYVGYTATPFANIFIHDQGATTNHGPDLFPRSFIVNLPTPSNYDGPVRIFGLEPSDEDPEGQPGLGLTRMIEDHAASNDLKEKLGWMPPVHKSGYTPLYEGSDEVPPSLRNAMLAFLLACAARRARGQTSVHNSMLVHVTRFTAVQAKVKSQVESALADVANELMLSSGAPGPVWAELRALWEADFEPTSDRVAGLLPDRQFRSVAWDEVSPHLSAVVKDVKVREINGSAGDVLDYETHKATGFNVIAIGGDKLARGLTLEGLTVSYFLRATRMYDTLMQMGRWFGYRTGYVDLCRLFTTADLEEWFCHITDASEELRREFDHMQSVGGTPADYGLKVKAHPVLMVTSRVKMRSATALDLIFSGALQETVAFHRSGRKPQANLDLTAAFLTKLGPAQEGVVRQRPGGRPHSWEGARAWTGVPGDQVADYLEQYATHSSAVKMNGVVLADYVRRQLPDDRLTKWDVVLLGGSQDKGQVGPFQTPLLFRSNEGRIEQDQQIREDRVVIRRLLAPRDEAIDLEAAEYEEALQSTVKEYLEDPSKFPRRKTVPDTPSGPWIRRVRGRLHPERGLLLIYPLDPAAWALPDRTDPVIGLGVSFPEIPGSKPVRYMVTNLYYAQEIGDEA